jgi:DNA repair protein RecO (recombination protein O)
VRARIALQPAWLLTSRPYSDSSLLLEAFTREHGRIGLVARGARGRRSKLRGCLQLFTPLLLSWNESGELGTLSGAEASGPPLMLSGERVIYGWYLNELLTRLLQRQDAHPALYDYYNLLLPELAGYQAAAETALRLFEKYLLAEIGYGLLLPEELQPQQRYRYDWDHGPQAAHDGFAGSSLIALREGRIDTIEAQQETRSLLRAALRRQLGGRELETPKLLRSLRGIG